LFARVLAADVVLDSLRDLLAVALSVHVAC
jgi:hypothetical protein